MPPTRVGGGAKQRVDEVVGPAEIEITVEVGRGVVRVEPLEPLVRDDVVVDIALRRRLRWGRRRCGVLQLSQNPVSRRLRAQAVQ